MAKDTDTDLAKQRQKQERDAERRESGKGDLIDKGYHGSDDNAGGNMPAGGKPESDNGVDDSTPA